jgi:hypothetical protein
MLAFSLPLFGLFDFILSAGFSCFHCITLGCGFYNESSKIIFWIPNLELWIFVRYILKIILDATERDKDR